MNINDWVTIQDIGGSKGSPRDLRSPSAISRNRWNIEIWPISKLSVSSNMTEFLAVISQKKFKTRIKFCPDRGSNSRPSRFWYNAVTHWAIGPYSSDYYYSLNSPNFIKIRPVNHQKQLSGSQIRVSIRITPNFELGLPMVIFSPLTKFHQNPTSSLWENLLTNKQRNKHTNKLENGTRRAQIPRKPLIFPSPNKQTNKQTNKNFWPHRCSNSRP